MSTFRDLLEGSNIFRGVIAVTVIGISGYLVINQIEPPDWWSVTFGAVTAFYFAGALSNQTARNTIRAHQAGVDSQ